MATPAAVDTDTPQYAVPLPIQFPLLLDRHPDPFSSLSGLKGNQPLYVVHPDLIRAGLFGMMDEGDDIPEQMEAAARLFTANINQIQQNAQTIAVEQGTEIPSSFQFDQPSLSHAQLEYYKEHPDLPQRPAHLARVTKNGPPVPVATSVKHLPTSVIAPMQQCFGSGWPASDPGTCISRLATRLLLPYDNPANLARHMAPPIPTISTRDPRRMEREKEKQNAVVQKMCGRNLLAEKLGYKHMTPHTHRRWETNHNLGLSNNHTHTMCFDGADARGRLMLRYLFRLAYPLGLGKEAHVGVHIAMVKLRSFENIAQLHQLKSELDKIESENGINCWEGATYSESAQYEFAKSILTHEQCEQWENGEFPLETQDKLIKDKQGRKSLNTVINIFKCDRERFENLNSDINEEDFNRKDYVAAICVYVYGLPPIILQVGHLAYWQLSPELTFLLMSSEVKKMVIGRKDAALAMKNSFDIPWDSSCGVIDIQEININLSLKPYNGGKLELADFVRLTGYSYWGINPSTLEERLQRLALMNSLAPAATGLNDETKSYYGLAAQKPLEGWHWTIAVNPDALLQVNSPRTKEVAQRDLCSANLGRVWTFQKEASFCKRYYPVYDINGEEVTDNADMLFDLQNDQQNILLVARDREEYHRVFHRYLESPEVGLVATAKAFHSAKEANRSQQDAYGTSHYFGDHHHYGDTPNTVGIRSNEIEVYSEFQEMNRMHAANDLLSCNFSAVFDLAVYRAANYGSALHVNPLTITDSIVASILTMEIAVRPGTWSAQYRPAEPSNSTAHEERINRMRNMENYERMATRYRHAIMRQPVHFQLSRQVLDNRSSSVGKWMWKRLSEKLRPQWENYLKVAEPRAGKPHHLQSDIDRIRAALPSYDKGEVRLIVDETAPTITPPQPAAAVLRGFATIHCDVFPPHALEPKYASVQQEYEDVSLPSTSQIEQVQRDLSLDYGTVSGLPAIQSREPTVANFANKLVSIPKKSIHIDPNDDLQASPLPGLPSWIAESKTPSRSSFTPTPSRSSKASSASAEPASQHGNTPKSPSPQQTPVEEKTTLTAQPPGSSQQQPINLDTSDILEPSASSKLAAAVVEEGSAKSESDKSDLNGQSWDPGYDLMAAETRYQQYRAMILQAPSRRFDGRTQPTTLTPLDHYEEYFEHNPALFPGDPNLTYILGNRRQDYFRRIHVWMRCLLPSDRLVVIDHVYNFINGVLDDAFLYDVMFTAFTRFREMAQLYDDEDGRRQAMKELERLPTVIQSMASRDTRRQRTATILTPTELQNRLQVLMKDGPKRVPITTSEVVTTPAGSTVVTSVIQSDSTAPTMAPKPIPSHIQERLGMIPSKPLITAVKTEPVKTEPASPRVATTTTVTTSSVSEPKMADITPMITTQARPTMVSPVSTLGPDTSSAVPTTGVTVPPITSHRAPFHPQRRPRQPPTGAPELRFRAPTTVIPVLRLQRPRLVLQTGRLPMPTPEIHYPHGRGGQLPTALMVPPRTPVQLGRPTGPMLAQTQLHDAPAHPAAAAQLFAIDPPLQQGEEARNVFREILVPRLEAFYQRNRPLINFPHIGVGFHGYNPTFDQIRELERFIEAVLEVEQMTVGTNEHQLALYIVAQLDPTTQERFEIICGGMNRLIETCERLILQIRLLRRQCEVFSQLTAPGYESYQQYRTAPDAPPLTPKEKEELNLVIFNIGEYVIEMPTFTGKEVRTRTRGTIPIQGQYNHRDRQGRLVMDNIRTGDIDPHRRDRDSRKYEIYRKRVLHAGKLASQTQEWLRFLQEYRQRHNTTFRPTIRLGEDGEFQPTLADALETPPTRESAESTSSRSFTSTHGRQSTSQRPPHGDDKRKSQSQHRSPVKSPRKRPHRLSPKPLTRRPPRISPPRTTRSPIRRRSPSPKYRRHSYGDSTRRQPRERSAERTREHRKRHTSMPFKDRDSKRLKSSITKIGPTDSTATESSTEKKRKMLAPSITRPLARDSVKKEPEPTFPFRIERGPNDKPKSSTEEGELHEDSGQRVVRRANDRQERYGRYRHRNWKLLEAADAVDHQENHSLDLSKQSDLKIAVQSARKHLYNVLLEFFREQARVYGQQMPDRNFPRDFPQYKGLSRGAKTKFDSHAASARHLAREQAGLSPKKTALERKTEEREREQQERQQRCQQRSTQIPPQVSLVESTSTLTQNRPSSRDPQTEIALTPQVGSSKKGTQPTTKESQLTDSSLQSEETDEEESSENSSDSSFEDSSPPATPGNHSQSADTSLHIEAEVGQDKAGENATTQ